MRLICSLALVLLLAQAPTSAAAPPFTPTEVVALEQQSRPSRAGRAGAVVVGGPAPPLLTTACTGNSKKLPAAQCAAWIKFYDGTNGDGWTKHAASCTRNDPCGCQGYDGEQPVCNPTNTTVITMCVCPPRATPPPPARALPVPLPPDSSV